MTDATNAAAPAAKDSLEFVSPTAVTLVVDGQTISITPLLVKDLPRVIRATDAILGILLYEADSLDAVRLVSLLGQHGEAITEAVGICIRKDPEWVQNLLPDRLATLAMAAIEVNADFFTRALAGLKGHAPKVAPTLAARIMANPLPSTRPSTG